MRNKELRVYTCTQINGSHETLQIRSYRESKEGKITSGGARREERLLGEDGIRDGHIKIK